MDRAPDILLTPLELAVRVFGSHQRIARICGIHEKSPYQWNHGATYRQPGDIPHSAYIRMLVDDAARLGFRLTERQLVRGATLADLASVGAPGTDSLHAEIIAEAAELVA